MQLIIMTLILVILTVILLIAFWKIVKDLSSSPPKEQLQQRVETPEQTPLERINRGYATESMLVVCNDLRDAILELKKEVEELKSSNTTITKNNTNL